MWQLDRRALLLGLAAAPAAVRAQDAWPGGPVRMIVPFPGGSTPDLVARVVAGHFETVFGRPFVPDNRPGAGGTTGTGLVAAAADGLTMGVTINGPITTAEALYPSLRYDPARDLALISLLVRMPQLLVVHPGIPAEDLDGFIAHAKARPGAMSYGSVGPGSAGHLGMEDVKARAGIELVHVAYKGFPEATLDLISGRIQAMMVTVSAVLPQIQAGKARALAVTADARIPQLTAVPTMAEARMPDSTSYAWIGLIAPSATPAERVERLAAEARTALTEPASRARLEKAGFEIVASTPAEFASFAAVETARWSGVVRRLGITLGG